MHYPRHCVPSPFLQTAPSYKRQDINVFGILELTLHYDCIDYVGMSKLLVITRSAFLATVLLVTAEADVSMPKTLRGAEQQVGVRTRCR